MKLKLNRTMLACMSSALVAGAAFAQNDPTTPQGGTQSGSTTRSGQSGSTIGRESWRHGMMQGQSIQASKLMGAQVKGSTGDNLGTINDFVVNPQTGRIEFAVLSLTGPTGTTPTGVGEKLTPVPWRLLNFNSGAGGIGQQQYTFTATVDQSKLQSAPNFDKNQWPDFSQTDWHQKIYSHYGVSREGSTGGTGSGLEKGGTNPSTEKGSGAGGLQPKSDTQ